MEVATSSWIRLGLSYKTAITIPHTFSVYSLGLLQEMVSSLCARSKILHNAEVKRIKIDNTILIIFGLMKTLKTLSGLSCGAKHSFKLS